MVDCNEHGPKFNDRDMSTVSVTRSESISVSLTHSSDFAPYALSQAFLKHS
jgi:hypothetical protein